MGNFLYNFLPEQLYTKTSAQIMVEHFRASVKFNDYTGTAAASGHESVFDFVTKLKEKDLMTEVKSSLGSA